MYNIVFEGGGIKGICYVGVLKYLEENNIKIDNLAGSSAGAIVAALIDAGYNSDELKEIFYNTNFSDLKSKNIISNIPFVGNIINVLINKGMYKTDKLEQWVYDLLDKKGVRTFKDLTNTKVVAVDVSDNTIVVFPDDLEKYNLSLEETTVASVVTMSSTIPIYYMPYKLHKNNIVDGGLISEIPLWLFETENTLGILIDEQSSNDKCKFLNYYKQLIKSLTSHDKNIFENQYDIIKIPVSGIGTTEFELTEKKKDYLFNQGYAAIKNYFEKLH